MSDLRLELRILMSSQVQQNYSMCVCVCERERDLEVMKLLVEQIPEHFILLLLGFF
jgi:hypothetical protein